MVNENHGAPIRSRSKTADYPRPNSHNQTKERALSAKQANKSLVTKISEKKSAQIPDVIASHGKNPSSEITNEVKNVTQMETRDKVSQTVMNNGDVRAKKYEIPSSAVSHMAAKVEERYEASTSKINNSTSKLDGTVEDVNVQVHRPSTGVSSFSMESNGSRFTDEANLEPSVESILEDYREKKKRKSSFTHSESEAVGTLDEVLREFNDVGDNLDELGSPTQNKAIEVQPTTPDFDPSYESITDIKEMLTDRNDVKANGVQDGITSNFNITTAALQHENVKNELVPPTNPEPVYAKPQKPISGTGSKINPGNLITPQAPKEKSPVVPPKRFVVESENHEIKFSPLRKTTSPSASLSKSLNSTAWANANEVPSPKRKPVKDNNDNFSLKRGQLSGPVPISIDDVYVEPPRDYDVNTTLSSVAKSSTDGSFNRDTWGSMTSSSTSGSRKVKKEFRPEALKMIEKSKAEKEGQKKIEGRQYDGLVNLSFRLTKGSLKETAAVKEEDKEHVKDEDKAHVKEEDNASEIGSDFASIKNEADVFLEGYERMRASSEGKKELALKASVDKKINVPTVNHGEQGLKQQVTNGFPLSETTVLNPTDNKQPADGSDSQATTNKILETKKAIKEKNKSHLEKDEENDSDDEDLVRLMETGVTAENPTNHSPPEQQRFGYVPRALRMSFGQSWQGIRKDRREWKSREMKHASAQSSRKGGKTLSNRFDEQEVQLEMLF
jgi:hypothetical protein